MKPVDLSWVPADVIDEQGLREGDPLTWKAHWLRLFIPYNDGQLHANEVLLDSQQWPGGEAAVVADARAPVRRIARIAADLAGRLVCAAPRSSAAPN